MTAAGENYYLALDVEATGPLIMGGNAIPAVGAVVYSSARGALRSLLLLIAPIGTDYDWDEDTRAWWARTPGMPEFLALARRGATHAEARAKLAQFVQAAKTEFPKIETLVDCAGFDDVAVQLVLGTAHALHMRNGACKAVVNTHDVYRGALGGGGSIKERIDARFGITVAAHHDHNPVHDATGIAERYSKYVAARARESK
jgi:hypothetical protein